MRTVSPCWPVDANQSVRVAVLDTGVDVSHSLLCGPFHKGQIVYQNFVGPETKIPRDDHGHGTHVTSILLKAAPNVSVYVGRVSATGKSWDSFQVKKVGHLDAILLAHRSTELLC
jgi:subtilisin family serine protease